VAPGTYTIKVSLSGYVAGEIPGVEVSDSDVSGKDITLTKIIPFTITGRIVTGDEGSVSGAKLELREFGATTVYETDYAASDGTFSIDPAHVPPEKHIVLKVTLVGYQTYTTDEFVVNDHSITLLRVENKTITAFVGDDKIVLSPSNFTVSGTITTDVPGGAGVGATVDLKNKSGGQAGSASADSNGNYSIADVPKGDGYYILVTLTGYQNNGSVNRSESFSVSTSDVTGKNLTLKINRYEVSGVIFLGTTSTRANSPTVNLKQAGVEYTADTYSNGEYEFEGVPAGTYTLEASYSGYKTDSRSVTVSGDIEDKNIILEPLTYSISGIITLNGGSGSVTDVSVQLRQGGTPVGNAVAPVSSGAYAISNVVNGTYTIEASLDGYDSGQITAVTVSGGNVTGQNLTLEPETSGPVPIVTGTSLSLKQALAQIKASGSGEYVIELGKAESGFGPYDMTGFSTPVTITIDGKNLYDVKLATNSTTSSAGFIVQSGVTFIIKDVILTGSTATSSGGASIIRVKNGGKFQMEADAMLTGNLGYNGGGVYVESGGNYIMIGGSITGNKTAGYGGGVYIANGGGMTISGGLITGNIFSKNTNPLDGVYVGGSSSSLTMSGEARIDRIWLYDNSAAVTIVGDFSGSDTVATLDLKSTSNGRQVLKAAAGYSNLATVVTRFSLGGTRSGNTSVPSPITSYTIGSDGKLK
jgi:hypothetical protein